MPIHQRIFFKALLPAMLACCSIPAPSTGAEAGTITETTPENGKPLPAHEKHINPLLLKTASAVTNHLDDIHDKVFLHLQRPARRVDNLFAGKDDKDQSTTVSKFRVGWYVVMKDEDGLSTRFEPDVDAEIRIPSLEERWGIFIDSVRNNDLPGTDPTERKSYLSTGVRHLYEDWNINADAGVRWRGGPAGLARLEWKPDFSIGKTRFYPRQRLFYESWDGYGEMTSLTINRTMGCFLARLVSGARWSQSSNGLEWEQTAILGHAFRLIEENKPNALISDNDVAQGFSLRYSIFGHNATAERQIDRHRITMVYRQPLYKNWLFLQVAPGMEWTNENEWHSTPSLQIGIDSLFWEVAKKR